MLIVNIPVYFLAKKTVRPDCLAPEYEVLSGPDANRVNFEGPVRMDRYDRHLNGLAPGESLVLLSGQWGSPGVREEVVS